MSEETIKRSGRDPERSREAILDAAERLFADKGYEETSLQEIGQVAGVSRGTPGYFFGTKEQLYGAVLDRVVQAEYNSVAAVLLPGGAAGIEPENVLAQAVSNFFDFLIARPTFVRLIEREALSNARFLRERSAYLVLFEQALALISTELGKADYRQIDPTQFLLSITALCWFPLAHTETFVRPLGIDAQDAAFWAARKQHIIDLVLYGVTKDRR